MRAMNQIRRSAMLNFVLLISALCSLAQDPPALTTTGTATAPVRSLAQQGGQTKVICSGDQLTISANGSPLSTILSEVSRCSGAKIDGSESTVRMKVFETIGPAPIREVLTSLLDATGMNFVIQVSDVNPRKIATVLLLSRAERASGGEEPSIPAGHRTFLKQMQQNSRETEEAAPADESADVNAGIAAEARSGDAPDSGLAAVEGPQATAARVPAAAVDSAPTSSQMNLQDRIADMQRMFEQRKQMLQDQNSHPH